MSLCIAAFSLFVSLRPIKNYVEKKSRRRRSSRNNTRTWSRMRLIRIRWQGVEMEMELETGPRPRPEVANFHFIIPVTREENGGIKRFRPYKVYMWYIYF